ncbi:MAG: heavy metal-associated domain-containing protein, partial [Acidobacteriaceae bacterium]
MPAAEAERAARALATQAGETCTITLPVIGMSCAACQTHVERALRETAGVREASVNLLTNSARVTYSP